MIWNNTWHFLAAYVVVFTAAFALSACLFLSRFGTVLHLLLIMGQSQWRSCTQGKNSKKNWIYPRTKTNPLKIRPPPTSSAWSWNSCVLRQLPKRLRFSAGRMIHTVSKHPQLDAQRAWLTTDGSVLLSLRILAWPGVGLTSTDRERGGGQANEKAAPCRCRTPDGSLCGNLRSFSLKLRYFCSVVNERSGGGVHLETLV